MTTEYIITSDKFSGSGYDGDPVTIDELRACWPEVQFEEARRQGSDAIIAIGEGPGFDDDADEIVGYSVEDYENLQTIY